MQIIDIQRICKKCLFVQIKRNTSFKGSSSKFHILLNSFNSTVFKFCLLQIQTKLKPVSIEGDSLGIPRTNSVWNHFSVHIFITFKLGTVNIWLLSLKKKKQLRKSVNKKIMSESGSQLQMKKDKEKIFIKNVAHCH